jgi:quinol-cytochrome oxidoreductase complex cytochrome b subunit/mono/diheme cytochrome c family protein
MIQRVASWFDHRTSVHQLLNEALYENIPSGARWRYVTGSMLTFAFVVQAITGIFLWMAYSPSSQTAYESVYYIQHEMTGGWLLRGVHHFMAQAMVVVMGLHLLQVVVDGAYRAPREFNYWLGLILMQLVLGLGLTGYLLPWDQKGYWATNVATNLMTLVPFVGKELQQIAIGGNEYGHHTLTRFFAMHAGVLPVLLVIFLVLHIALFRKHGITAKITPGRPDQYFWPHQVLLDAVACLALLVVVLLCVVHFDVGGLLSGNLPTEHRGAELGAPADPSRAYSAARPEWYYLFLFQLLKYFHGTAEVIGALVIPGLVMLVLFLLPLTGRSQWGHRFNVSFVVLLLGGAGVLTVMALSEDYFVYVADALKLDPAKHREKIFASQEFLAAKKEAEEESHRIHELIRRREVNADGQTISDARWIPKQGAVYLLRNDPLTHGPKLFAQHCASCHDYRNPNDPDGAQGPRFASQAQLPKLDANGKVQRDEKGDIIYDETPNGAPNLYGFASREWIRGLLDPNRIASIEYGKVDPPADGNADDPSAYRRPVIADYFGNTNHRDGRMVEWVKAHADLLKDDPNKHDEDIDAIVAALSAQAQLHSQAEMDAKDSELIARGVVLINQNCNRGCHRLGNDGQLGLAPDLTGYGSYDWMMGLVSDPAHERFYRLENDRMPSFAADLKRPENNSVSLRELSLIVDWLRGDYYDPKDERPILQHSEERARAAAAIARTTSEPLPEVIGARKSEQETAEQRAIRLFTSNCSACHSHTDEEGHGIVAIQPSAPNLYGFASREWLAGLLNPEQIVGDRYFGNTSHVDGDMAGFVKDDLGELDDDGKATLASLIAALSAEAALPAQAEADKKAEEDGSLEKGREALTTAITNSACTDCHKFRDNGDLGSAPDLTGYGSREWLIGMISDPKHEQYYPNDNDRMPAFGRTGAGPTKQPLLSPADIELIAKWLRGEPLE